MKNIFGLFLVLFVGIQQLVYAQTGIGTNSPNEQAVLDIQSVDKGVLFPSISLTSTTTFLGGISATASHTNMLVYNTNTATTTTGLDGAGYYFWNGSNWEKITGDTDDQSLAEVTAIGNTTNDVIAVGGVLDSGTLTVVGDTDLQGNVDLGDTYLDTISILATIDTDLLFQAGKNVASPTRALVAVYSSELKPGSGDDLSINTNSTSERINFSNNGVIMAGVNSSTFFIGDISGPNHYKLPSGTATRAIGQILTVSSTLDTLYFADASSNSTPTLAEVSTQGSITTNELQVGGLTVSGTIGLTIGESSSQYKLPTRRGAVGQSLVVSSTTGQLEFSSPAYLLANNYGGGFIDMTKINTSTAVSGHEVGKFLKVSGNNISITTTHSSSDTIKLPAGKSFKLTAYVGFSGQQNQRINYKFYNRTGTKYQGLEGSSELSSYGGSSISLPAVTYIEASNNAVEVGLYVVSYVGGYTSENIGNKYTRIEVEEIK